jgi:hypothetical protein
MLRAEIARSIRAIDFKPIIATVGRDQPEVVQKRGAKCSFFVSHRTAEASDGKTAENVGSKAMRAEKFGRTGFQKVHRGNAQSGIRNSNTGHGFQAHQGHLSLPGSGHSSVDAHGGQPQGLRPRRAEGGKFGATSSLSA